MSGKHSKTKDKSKSPLKWIIIGGLGLLLIAVLGALFIGRPAQETTSLPAEISVDQAHDLYNQGVFILDVRTQEEWDEYHIPNATLIPLDELPDRLDEVPTDQEVVVVCRSGNRSKQGRDILEQAGYEQVTSMSGGLNSWQAQGYPVVSGP